MGLLLLVGLSWVGFRGAEVVTGVGCKIPPGVVGGPEENENYLFR